MTNPEIAECLQGIINIHIEAKYNDPDDFVEVKEQMIDGLEQLLKIIKDEQ